MKTKIKLKQNNRDDIECGETNEKQSKLTEIGMKIMTESTPEYAVQIKNDDEEMTLLEHLDVVRNALIRKGRIDDLDGKVELLNRIADLAALTIASQLREINDYLKR
jgi:hypothetical protein